MKHGRRGDFWSKVQRGDASSCWPWIGAKTSENGYGSAYYRGRTTTAHRVAFLLSGGTIQAGAVVMHTCDNPVCCNPGHLSAGTQQENIADMHRKGRAGDCRNFGEQHGRAKLTDQHVRRIRALSVLGLSQCAIAEMYGVGQSQISRIVRLENRRVMAA